MDYQVLLAKALLEITRLESGTIFEVKDLFPPHEWKSYRVETKLDSGSIFLESIRKVEFLVSKNSKEEKTITPDT